MTSLLLHLFLVGGGWDAEASQAIYGRFIEAATQNERRSIVSIHVAEADDSKEDKHQQIERSQQVFYALGVKPDQLVTITLEEGETLTAQFLANFKPTGVFVWGGLTPLYQQVLTQDTSWVQYLHEHDVVYGGFSAGAVISAEQALVGGWQMQADGRTVAIMDEDLSEGLDTIEVRPGLGLLPVSIDVHASQWGTVTRLLHAVEQQQVADNSWAIDENTTLEIQPDGTTHVWGMGQAYRIQRTQSGQVNIAIYRQGDDIN
jgi:cyanophycinase